MKSLLESTPPKPLMLVRRLIQRIVTCALLAGRQLAQPVGKLLANSVRI